MKSREHSDDASFALFNLLLDYEGRVLRMTLPSDAANPVALVCTELRVGGAEQCVARLACGVDREKFSPRVVSLAPRPAPGKDQLVQRLEDNRVPVDFLGVTSSWQWLQARRSLRKSLHEQSTDIVQSFLFHANMLSLSAAPKNTPVSTGIRVADPRKWRHFAERRVSHRASSIVCVSHSVASFCRDVARFPADKLRVIPNGISMQGLPAPGTALPDLQNRRILLCVGRLHHQKGYDWLLDQWASWSTRLPEYDLVIVGDGPDREALQTQAQQLGIVPRVHFLGQRNDVPGLLAISDLVLLPSRWEGMPNVVLEAMACGRPLVASQVEGVTELLGDSLSPGQSAPFGDESQWIHRIVSLLSDSEHSARLGEANRLRIEDQFQAHQMVSRYQSLFSELLS